MIATMDKSNFVAGVEPGGFTHDYEIKILICYLLYNLEQPLSFEQMDELLENEGVVNYFEFSDAISKLLHSNHIFVFKTENNEDFYTITELGAQTAVTFQKTLPYTVRKKTLEAAQTLVEKKKSEAQNVVSIKKVPDGCIVRLTIKDIGSDLFDLSLFTPNQKQAELVKKNFLKDPLTLYKCCIDLLTDENKE